MDDTTDYGERDSRKRDLADKELTHLETKYQYYLLKIAMLYLYEKCRAKPDVRKLMDRIYAALDFRERCLLDIDCDIHEMIQRFEAYPNDRERLEWFEDFILER